ncbi:uncharacterized protein LOC121368707 [Gigantopelta aegis]|uniref:uncharacterized protein LOC121368707 n=1 Tax=Gigantopelta aegis TaxID=1735272 RepID=UPI001B88CB0B|nr:uncharacterized protein LOC121368707 [Gigantopelta aegis]XP_041349386.1 uncharacterized protein LOC121368707 [Gigantopelta aegis]XP_041349387.1 uncharacterized protein LOC121368707 [Gigantopelta aegis]
MDPYLPASPLVETFDEFDEPVPMHHSYCQQLSMDEIEEQSETATQRGLNDLIKYLEQNPEAYAKIMRKKKVEDLENGGIFSYLKVKMMSVLHGDQYPACLVTPEETCNQLNEVKSGMIRAFQYSQDSKGRRFSSRLAKKRKVDEIQTCDEKQSSRRRCDKSNTRYVRCRAVSSQHASPTLIPVAKIAPSDSTLAVPTPPPPPPPLVQTPRTRLQLQRPPLHKENVSPTESISDHEFVTPPERTKKHQRTVSNGSITSMTSITSLSSIHSELMSSNPLKKLKCTDITRSPGGTPLRPRASGFAPSEPLHKALINVMKKKFRNVRTPSPRSANHSRNSSHNNSSSFSPGFCLSP